MVVTLFYLCKKVLTKAACFLRCVVLHKISGPCIKWH